jgi:NAD(P)-dependent dehydrogenase (short-subunit alcohol dehydrogenase family)
VGIGAFDRVAKENKTRYFYITANIADAEQVSKTLEAILPSTRFPLRGVVTCAGISGEVDAVDYPSEAFRKLLDANVLGTFLPVQAAARIMQKQEVSGSIVLVASISGHVSNKVLLCLTMSLTKTDPTTGSEHCRLQLFKISSSATCSFACCGVGLPRRRL